MSMVFTLQGIKMPQQQMNLKAQTGQEVKQAEQATT